MSASRKIKKLESVGGGGGELNQDDLSATWMQVEDIHPYSKNPRKNDGAVQAVHNSSRKGSIVLDLFGGSGSTMIACEQLGRKNRSMELDPAYCDVIVNRWEEFTGKTAEIRE